MADPTARVILSAEDRTRAALASADRGLKQFGRSLLSTRSLLAGFGIAFSGRALAGWIGGALKAAEATGEHAAQIKAAQEAMAGMKKASDALAMSIGSSLTPAFVGLTAVLIGWNRIISNADPFPFEKQIEDLRDTLKIMEAQFASSGGMRKEWRDDFQSDIDAVKQSIDELIAKQRVALGLDSPAPVAAAFSMASLNRLKNDSTLSNQLGLRNKPRIEFEVIPVLAPEFSVADLGITRLFEELPGPEIDMEFLGLSPEEFGAELDRMKEDAHDFAESLGMSFRDAFADWIVDTERGFGDLLKRMTAQLATSALFQGLSTFFPAGGLLSKFFGGSRASGGSAREGMVYKVHPGEAFFTPGSDGHVAAAAGPSYHFETHIDARGADSSLVTALPRILAENNRRLKAEIADNQRRGRF